MTTELEKGDIQAIVLTGYPKHPHARYVLVSWTDPNEARQWVRHLSTRVATAARRPTGGAVNVAFTAAGLRALGLDDDALRSFSMEFQEGIAGNEHRSRVLGDVDRSAPSTWAWGGPDRAEIHAMLMVYGASGAELDEIHAAYRAPSLREVYARDSVTLPERKEHFGFADGLAQPRVKGSGARPKEGAPLIEAGEFVLGYPNEYQKLPPSPSVDAAFDPESVLSPVPGGDRRDFGRNGTYLVVRQLAQDVEGFWRTMYEHSRDATGAPDRDRAVHLASRCVGRWPSGASLVRTPERDDPRYRDDNGFGYRDDPEGRACPVGSHVRRSNPRDSLEPGPDESLASVNRHRILRRGRSYGAPLAPFEKKDAAAERGLFFICVNANIRRQFEFIQQTWINNPKLNGLYEDKDPLLGDHDPEKGGTFTIPGSPERRRLTRLPRFVTVRGGAYFFLPSVRALTALGRRKA